MSTHAMAGLNKYTRAMFYRPEPETPEELYYDDKQRMADDVFRRRTMQVLEQYEDILKMLERSE